MDSENNISNEIAENDGSSLENNKNGLFLQLFDWLDVIVSAAVVVVLIFTFVFRVATVQGRSMENTFFENDKLIISNVLYKPEQGDVVIISRNVENTVSGDTELPIIKRVIAVENQTVDIDFNTGVVFVDGKALDEPYTKTPTKIPGDINFPVTVPENCVFVLGDNRNDSLDSRFSIIGDDGMIDTRYILGRVVLRISPFDKIQGF